VGIDVKLILKWISTEIRYYNVGLRIPWEGQNFPEVVAPKEEEECGLNDSRWAQMSVQDHGTKTLDSIEGINLILLKTTL
jgi:hypothetical protein